MGGGTEDQEETSVSQGGPKTPMVWDVMDAKVR